MKSKLRLLVSIFCIISSCILTLLFLFVSNVNSKNYETISFVNNKKSYAISNSDGDKKDNSSIEIKEVILKESDTNIDEVKVSDNNDNDNNTEEVIEPVIVYDGMTLEELSSKLEKSLKNELSGKGYLYASYSIDNGVDPYLALAISLEETGCNFSCSNLVKYCNNVGGMIGSGCNGFSSWPTLDDGIRAFIDNIARNYVAYGLTTADTMNPKYAENPLWASNVNNYIRIIKSK